MAQFSFLTRLALASTTVAAGSAPLATPSGIRQQRWAPRSEAITDQSRSQRQPDADELVNPVARRLHLVHPESPAGSADVEIVGRRSTCGDHGLGHPDKGPKTPATAIAPTVAPVNT